MDEKEFDFLLHRKISITVNEKVKDKIKTHKMEGYVAYIKYGMTGGPKLYIIRDGGIVNWIHPNRGNISNLRIKILDWKAGEKEKDISRAELIDLEE